MARKPSRADVLNEQTYHMYYNRLRDYALSMFQWEGLEEHIGVNERFLEITMYKNGRTVWFIDDSLGQLLAMPVIDGGAVDIYNNPTKYKAYSTGYNKDLTPEEAVIMYSNYSRTPMDFVVRLYAQRLTQVERTMDVNIAAQKTPLIVLAEESQRLTLKNALEQYEGFEPFVFGNKSGFDKEAFQVLLTPAPFVTDKLMEYKHNLWNEAMTFLGVGNAKQDKKERLVADEVAANDEQITGARQIFLKARQEACEKINKMFGTNISVDFKFNKDQEEAEEKAMAAAKEGEKENG